MKLWRWQLVKAEELDLLRRVADSRIVVREVGGGPESTILNVDCESAYFITKYGNALLPTVSFPLAGPNRRMIGVWVGLRPGLAQE